MSSGGSNLKIASATTDRYGMVQLSNTTSVYGVYWKCINPTTPSNKFIIFYTTTAGSVSGTITYLVIGITTGSSATALANSSIKYLYTD